MLQTRGETDRVEVGILNFVSICPSDERAIMGLAPLEVVEYFVLLERV